MTGLAFPTDANFNREASYEDGTPISNDDDIPIDPALTGALDPTLIAESKATMKIEQVSPFSSRLIEFNPWNASRRSQTAKLTDSNFQQPQQQIPQHDPYITQHFSDTSEIDKVRQYSQGPQGDPFAPQVSVPYFPFEPFPTEPPQPAKQRKKRRVKRDEECGFCAGTDRRNKHGQPEKMASCHECGRSGTSSLPYTPRLQRLIEL